MPRSGIRLLVLGARIERLIRGEMRRRFPNFTRLVRLKKMRLRVKDALANNGQGPKVA
jgi:hypothetical protein